MSEPFHTGPYGVYTRYKFDVFLSYAGENKVFAEKLKEALRQRGLRAWIDSIQMIVGLSLREQIDRGLADSRFVCVILSGDFFAKRWTQRELDGAFALESDKQRRVLPIWYGVDERQVREFSPILASIFAHVVTNDDAVNGADAITRSIDHHLEQSGEMVWSDFIRRDIEDGLVWVRPPQLYPASLALADALTGVFWEGRDAVMILPWRQVHLAELFEESSRFDGERVAVAGVQVFQQLLTYGPGVIQQYVVQLKDPQYPSHLLYVLLAERTQEEPDVPRCPPGYLTLARGVIVARGAMQAHDGLYSAVYMVAARVQHVPAANEGN